MSRICNVFNKPSMKRDPSFVVVPVSVVSIGEAVAVTRSIIVKKTILTADMTVTIGLVAEAMAGVATDVSPGNVVHLMDAVTVAIGNPKVLRK